MVDLAVLAMLIDGQAVQVESTMLGTVIAQQPVFDDVDAEEFGRLVSEATDRLERWGELATALEHIAADLGTGSANRIAAFGIVYAIVCADGTIVAAEDDFLSAVADAFELTQVQVDRVMAVIDESLESDGESGTEYDERTQPDVHRLSRRGVEHTPIALTRVVHA